MEERRTKFLRLKEQPQMGRTRGGRKKDHGDSEDDTLMTAHWSARSRGWVPQTARLHRGKRSWGGKRSIKETPCGRGQVKMNFLSGEKPEEVEKEDEP